MARLRYNGLTAELGADLAAAGTTITFAAALSSAAGAVPTITGTDYIPLAVLAADGSVLEIIHLTAYTSGATTGTVTRAQESTTAATHATGLTVVNGLTVADTAEFAGGGGCVPTDQGLSAQFTTTTVGSWVAVTGLTFTVTPATGGVFISTTRLSPTHSATGDAYARTVCSPAPADGPAEASVGSTVTAGKPAALSINGWWRLSGGVTYTFTTSVFCGQAGTLTMAADEGRNLAGGVFIPS